MVGPFLLGEINAMSGQTKIFPVMIPNRLDCRQPNANG